MKKAVESVTAGHPDKVCDQIADAIVDEFLRRDTKARVDLNVLGSQGMLMIGGEVDSSADFDLAELAKKVYKEIGYQDEIEVFVNIDQRNPKVKTGAHDSVVVNGYATRETREFLPRALIYAHNIARRMDDLRQTDPTFSWLQPDGKVQLVIEKDKILSAMVLASHSPDIETKEVQAAILDRILSPIIGEDAVQLFINPIGQFTICGFQADSGANGRKLAVDTYGGLIPHGDSALSGKDPYKAARCGSYMARYAARYLVEQGLAESAIINAAYIIGRAEPVHLEARGVGEKSRGTKMDLTEVVKSQFDFRPEAIVERLDLAKPLYRHTATYGHFGRLGFPWEESVK
ncbi:methionine adenosyltransferase [Patescibacteria group bacterium]|nr:methionine adenosyltransferase [Patescibacteria group bacterium]MBU1705580.1 methionine adenosyltransferase [Patescibacteria group bacterium]